MLKNKEKEEQGEEEGLRQDECICQWLLLENEFE
jgi:hypothetical protein